MTPAQSVEQVVKMLEEAGVLTPLDLPSLKEAERERVAAERAKDRQAVAPLRRRLEARAARQEPKRHRGRLTGVDQN